MATDTQWRRFTDDTFEGKPSGNAIFAQQCRETPLDARAILDLVYENIGYFGDSYYAPLTEPIEMRVREFYEANP